MSSTERVTRPGQPPRPVTPVGILAARLDQLVDRVTGTDLDPDLTAEIVAARDLAVGLDPYLERCTSPESPALATLAARTHAEDWNAHRSAASSLEQEMLSGHVEGQALKMLVHATGARRVLEIGLFTGYSALAMAEALPDGGRLVACEIDADVARIARESLDASGHGHRIEIRVGPARRTLVELAADGERFGLVFVDADKAGYADYVRTLLDADLLDDRALICVDNTLLQGQPWLPGPPTPPGAAIAAFNEELATDPRVEQVVLPLRDGLTLIRRVV